MFKVSCYNTAVKYCCNSKLFKIVMLHLNIVARSNDKNAW